MKDFVEGLLSDDKKFESAAKMAFNSVDTDGSGEIDKEELRGYMNQLANDMGVSLPSDKEVKDMLASLDCDGSGEIDFKEFKIFFKDFLKSLC